MLIKYFVLSIVIISCLSKRNCTCTAQETPRKNVLFIIVDDLRPALHAAGDKNAITPNIDEFIHKSTYFTNAFAQQSLCAPSRNSILTSRRPDTLKLYDFYSYWRDVVGDFVTLPQYFKENGYFTYSIGKVFHPGKSSNFTDDYPHSWSRPTFHARSEPYLNSPVCLDVATESLTNNLLCPIDTKFIPLHTLPDIEATEHAVKIMKDAYKNSSIPFFIGIGFHKPHIPFMFPREFLNFHDIEKFDHPNDFYKPHDLPVVAWAAFNDLRKRNDVKRENLSYPFGTFDKGFSMKIRQHYYASVTYIDSLIGKLLKEVNYEDTIVTLVSDHGWSLGEHGEWAKYSNLDVALKVPLIIYDPDRINNNYKRNVIKEIVELIDIFPTLVQLTGLPILKKCVNRKTRKCTEGKSIVDLMKSIKNLGASAFSQYPRTDMYPSLIPNSDEPRLRDIQIMGYTIRTQQFRYTAWIPFNNKSCEGGDWTNILAEELYDHSIDEGEYINLAFREELMNIKEELFQQLMQKIMYF